MQTEEVGGARIAPAKVADEKPRRRRWRGMPLQGRLMLLAGATILPLAFCSVLAFAAMLHWQKMQVEGATLSMARSLSSEIDARLRQTISALEVFSLVQSLGEIESTGLPAAHMAAGLVRAARPEWRGIVLARPDGTVVFTTERPLGTGLGQVVEGSSLDELVRTRSPVIGPMATGPRGKVGFTVRVPVMHGAELKYVLSAILDPESILNILQRQQIPGDWVVSVFDSEMKRVARSRDHRRYFGTAPTSTVQTMLLGLGSTREAVGTAFTMEGNEAFTAVSRIDGTNWAVVLGASRLTAQGALWRAAALCSAGLILSLAIGGLAFHRISRSITGRAKALADSAVALGRGEPLTVPNEGLQEFDAVASALSEAGRLQTRHETERDALLKSETAARATAESVQGRLEMLLAATSSLSSSLDEPSTLNAAASAVVPEMADIFRIDLLNADGTLERKLTFHRDSRRVEQIDNVIRSGTVAPHTPGSMAWVIASGREYVHHFDDAGISVIEDPVFRRFVQVTGMRAVCTVPLIARGRTIGAMAAIQSSSDRRFGPDEVALLRELAKRTALALDNVRLYAECTTALEKASAASKTKDEFLAMLGHELRNPLAPILTALEILKRRDATAFARERQIMERQAKHLARLVDDLLDMSRIMAGKIHLKQEQVDLREVVRRALDVAQPLYEKRATPQVLGMAAPVFVRGDLDRLIQVVGNLLNNAAKFSERTEPVTVAIRQGDGGAEITVEDRGVGIPESVLPHVFSSFVQGPQNLQRAKGGLGVGLSIARNIVELHGGVIGAQKGSSGVGTRVTVSLPLFRVVGLTNRLDAQASEQHGPIRILVVDDNIDAAQMLENLLTLAGHEVAIAHSAEECLADVARVAPHACILDIGLPEMDGYELARRLRTDGSTRSLYLIALTGYGQYADRQNALDAGFDDHLTKPASFRVLEETLARVRS
jgi:signal transduction histidine kinase